MSLLDRVQADAQTIMNSTRMGFSSAVTLTDPDSNEYSINGIVSIIHNLIDPDTGQPVSGFLATISINAKDLNDLDIDVPEGEMSESSRPWLITHTDQFDTEQTMKISRSAPDETVGNILCDLVAYEVS